MPKSLAWKTLIPGAIATAAVIGLALWVLMYARIGVVRGDTYRLFVITDQARGVLEGTDVWLAGQKVGIVDEIRFRPPSTDTSHRLVLALDVLERYREQIRRNSAAQIRAGGTLIGAPVVHVSVGTLTAPVLEEGDTIPSLPQPDAEDLASQLAHASRQFPEITENVKRLRQHLLAAQGTLGGLTSEEQGTRLELLRNRATRLTRDALAGEGTTGLALQRRAGLLNRAQQAAARADSVRLLLATERATVGRFRRDSTLVRHVADLRNEISIVRALLDVPHGTLPRAQVDTAIQRELAQLDASMQALFEDLKEDPLRYISF